MTEVLNYARGTPPKYAKWLPILACAAIPYPLVLLALLYGEWWLAWQVLGYPPRPSMDDPKCICAASSCLHLVTTLALIGMLPAAGLGLVLNVADGVINRSSATRIALRVLGLIAVLTGAIVLMRWDPLQVAFWWGD